MERFPSTTYAYDEQGRFIGTQNDGGRTRSTYTSTYDKRGNLTSAVGASEYGSEEGTYAYDDKGAITSIEIKDTPIDSAPYRYTYCFDEHGLMTSWVFASQDGTITSTTISYEYDAGGKPVSGVEVSSSEGPSQKPVSFEMEYDDEGNLTRIDFDDGHWMWFEWTYYPSLPEYQMPVQCGPLVCRT